MTMAPLKLVSETALVEAAFSTAAARPLLRLAGISKTFANGVTALADVDLTIRPGEFVSLLGPSGCGKSTLLKLIAGLAAPSSGTIDWPQSAYDALGTPEPALGFVFQEPTLLPWRTVADNVHLPLMLSGTGKSDAKERVESVLELVGLSAFADSYPRQLSGGMKMRVSIARSLVTQPDLLLMDEPFGALDEFTRNRLDADLVRLWWERKLTTVFVTHSIYEAVFLSTRVIVMGAQPGRIFKVMSIDEPHPRDESFRNSPRFAEYCRALSAMLTEVSLTQLQR
jgi:NitT/TauT family transport system ATP-binding protein